MTLRFHDLRGTAVTMLSEAGYAALGMATIDGRAVASTSNILEIYLARSLALARGTIVKFAAH